MWTHKPHTKKPALPVYHTSGYDNSPGQDGTRNIPGHSGTRNTPGHYDTRNTPGQYGTRNETPGQYDTRNTPGQYGNRNEPPGQYDNRNAPSQYDTRHRTPGQHGTSTPGQYGPRNVDNSPSWLRQNANNTRNDQQQRQMVPYDPDTAQRNNNAPRTDDRAKKSRLFVYTAQIYAATVKHHHLRHMPLDLDNGLPAIEMRFGTTDIDELCFLCHIDSCAAMNTGNLRVHKYIMTEHPEIVCSYEQFDDENPFEPLSLACAVSMENITATYGKLTSVVTYHTQYKDKNGIPVKLAFGLGAEVAVNAIIGLPTLKKWKATIDVGNDEFVSKLLDLAFPLHYHGADSGLPPSIKFTSEDFVRPRPITMVGRAFVMQTDDVSAAITDTSRFEIQSTKGTDDISKGYLQRTIEDRK